MSLVPMVIKRTTDGERSMDLFSRLLDDRIIMLCEQFEDAMASIIVAQLLYLNSVDNTAPITMYINSPGGSVSSMWSIVDTMNHIKAPVHTICTGLAASAASMVLVAGQKGSRFALEHATVMIHQVSSGTQGQATDMEIKLKDLLKTKEELTRYFSQRTKYPYEKVYADMERDHYLSAKEALDYGIIDGILGDIKQEEKIVVTDLAPSKAKKISKK
jgi:ATP-dependent Clp protease, protease subunit